MIKLSLHFLLFFVFINTLFAGTTGKLSGKIIEAESKEPLIGVNVIIEGTAFGAATDVNGYFVINNIPPGEYTVAISAVGYQKKRIIKVKISVDFTTKLDEELSSEAITIETVVVEAKSPLIRTDLTSSQTTIDAQQIKNLPVESISQILTLQAGVTQAPDGTIHIRGGRSSEISYTVNGISISNPFDNSASISIATNAIQELSVISGTFNAEYGNAMSGIVNTITREGGNSLTGEISFYSGDHISSRQSTFFNVNDVDLLSNYVAEFTLGGPIPFTGNDASFFFSGRIDDDKGWLYGKREYNIDDHVLINPADPNDIKLKRTGDNAVVEMNPSKEISATSKFTYKPTSTIKINYDAIYSKSDYKIYSQDFKYNPEGTLGYHEQGLLNSVELRHAVDQNTFYSIKGSLNLNWNSSYLHPLLDQKGKEVFFTPGDDLSLLHPDPRHQPTEYLTTPAPYTFLFGGTQNGHNYERSNTIGVKLDLSSQVDRNHEIKFGLGTKIHKLDFESFTVKRDTVLYFTPTILGTNTSDHDYYIKKPFEFSAYLQDKMEYENIVVNIGLRYDLFDPKSQYSTNRTYPTPNDPQVPPYIDKSTLLADAKIKHQISPRIGISFPITDKGIIHFSYGHFFQMAPFRYLYANSEFEYSLTAGRPLFGNAELNPEKTVTYELGLQQQLFEDLAFNVTGFFKDIRDLLATQVIRVSGDRTYQKYVNKDYGSVKGITFTLTKRRTAQDMLGISVDYTYQTAEGNDNDPDAFFLDISSGRQAENVVIYLPWDQTHTLNTTISFGNPDDWNISLIGRLGTGLPYTPEIFETQISVKTNSGRRPSTARVDLLAEKIFKIYEYNLSIFLKVYNLFDTLNERFVYLDTGRAGYSLFQTTGGTKTTQDLSEKIPGVHSPNEYYQRPNYYYPPREVSLGFSFEF